VADWTERRLSLGPSPTICRMGRRTRCLTTGPL